MKTETTVRLDVWQTLAVLPVGRQLDGWRIEQRNTLPDTSPWRTNHEMVVSSEDRFLIRTFWRAVFWDSPAGVSAPVNADGVVVLREVVPRDRGSEVVFLDEELVDELHDV